VKDAIIVDLDGTLYDARERQKKHLLGEKKDFDAFHRDAEHDKPHYWCQALIWAMHHAGHFTVFTSGRDDTYRPETQRWLLGRLGFGTRQYELHMRPAGDYTADDTMKERWLKDLILPKYHVVFAIDDRKRVADMWRRNGITCLHCDEGNF
jgi:hypothetical protein